MDTKNIYLGKLANKRGLIIVLLLVAVSACNAQDGWIPPDVETVNDLSCKIQPIAIGWAVEAWARYANAEHHHNGQSWHLIIGIVKEKTERKSRRAANELCTDWTEAVRKKQIEKEKLHEKVHAIRVNPAVSTLQ